MYRIAIILVCALTIALGGCEEKEPEVVDEPSTTNVTPTEIYEDPNVINSEPPEAENEESGQDDEDGVARDEE